MTNHQKRSKHQPRPLAHLTVAGKIYPQAWQQFDVFRQMRGKDGFDNWPEWCYCPLAAAYAIVSGGGDNRVAPDELGCIAAAETRRPELRLLIDHDDEQGRPDFCVVPIHINQPTLTEALQAMGHEAKRLEAVSPRRAEGGHGRSTDRRRAAPRLPRRPGRYRRRAERPPAPYPPSPLAHLPHRYRTCSPDSEMDLAHCRRRRCRPRAADHHQRDQAVNKFVVELKSLGDAYRYRQPLIPICKRASQVCFSNFSCLQVHCVESLLRRPRRPENVLSETGLVELSFPCV